MSKHVSKKILSLFIAIMMVFSSFPVVSVYAAGGSDDYATVSAITDPSSATIKNNGKENITITYDGDVNLDWYAKNSSIERYADGWWVGIKITAPDGMSIDELKEVKYQTLYNGFTEWNTNKSFWNNQDSDKNSTDDIERYIQMWGFINESVLNTAISNNDLIRNAYEFDWDSDGDYEQRIDFNIKPSAITLNKGEQKVYPSASSGSVSAITKNLVTESDKSNVVTVKNDGEITLQWSQKNAYRTSDGWWAGIKITAPEGFSTDAKYRTRYNGFDTWSGVKSFATNKDGTDYIEMWGYLDEKVLERYTSIDNYYMFDWDADGVYEQFVTFSINPNDVVLDKTKLYAMDKAAPEISGLADSTSYSNNDVTVDFNVVDGATESNGTSYSSGIKGVYYTSEKLDVVNSENVEAIDNSATEIGDNEFSFTVSDDNDERYYIYAVDNSDNIAEADVLVQVDKTAPIFADEPTISAAEWTSNDVTITGKVNDNLSGITDKNNFTITTDAVGVSLLYNSTDDLSGEYTINIPAQTFDGEISLDCVDNAGNKSTQSFNVKMDKTNCVIMSLEVSESDWTNGNVMITGTVKDLHSGVDSVNATLENGDVYEATYNKVDDNEGNFEIVIPAQNYKGICVVNATDKVGNNSAEKDATISSLSVDLKMDNSNPVVKTTEATITDWTNKDITVSGLVSDNLSDVKAVYYAKGNSIENAVPVDTFENGEYSFKIDKQNYAGDYTVYCLDNAGNVSDTKSVAVKMDISNPVGLEVVYPNSNRAKVFDRMLQALTFGFYKPTVTVTLKANDPADPDDNLVAVSGIKEYVYTVNELVSNTIVIDNETVVSSDNEIELNLPANDGEYVVEFKVTDNANNTTEYTISSNGNIQGAIIDTGKPEVTEIIYNNQVNQKTVNEKIKRYFDSAVTIDFAVDEEYFFEELIGETENVDALDKDVDIKINKNGSEYATFEKSFNESESKISIAIPATENDGDFVITLAYTDPSGNDIEISTDTIVIDTTNPLVSIEYDNNTVSSKAKDETYFDANRIATITVEEHNFAPEYIESAITAVDVNGEDVTDTQAASDLAGIGDVANWTKDGNTYTFTIEYSSDANYTFELTSAKDYALNEMNPEGYEVAYAEGTVSPEKFTIDKVAPSDVEITYSQSIIDKILGGVTFGFYKAPCTVTLTTTDETSGVQYFDYSYDVNDAVNTANNGNVVEKAEVTSREGSTFVSEFEIPAQFRGKVTATATDNSGNTSNDVTDAKNIVVDDITSTMSVSYSDPVNTINGIDYYSEDVTVTVNVTEENFMDGEYPSEVRDMVIKAAIVDDEENVSEETYEINNWTRVNNTDEWQGSFVLSTEGDYTLTIDYTDLSTNKVDTYTRSKFTIDKTNPLVSIEYDNNNVSTKAKDNTYFDANRTATITVEEHNFAPEYIKSAITAVDVNGEDVTDTKAASDLAGIGDVANWTKDGNTYTFTIEYSTDANYTFEFTSAKDYALNEMNPEGNEVAYAERTVSPEKFTVDKVKPADFKISYSESVIDKVLGALTFGFYKEKCNVTLTADDITSGVQYFTYSYKSADDFKVISEGINDTDSTSLTVNKPSYKAEFVIPAEFRGNVFATVTDNSGNTIDKVKDDKIIVADTIAPTVEISTPKIAEYASKLTYPSNFNFNIKINDNNSGIGSIVVKINGEVIDEDLNGNVISKYYASEKGLIEDVAFEVSTSQVAKNTEGVYNIELIVEDNSKNKTIKNYEAYIDVYAPMITDFDFETSGDAYYADAIYKNGEKTDLVPSEEEYNYGCYFQKDTEITVYACDYNKNGLNKHTSGIASIDLLAINVDGSKANVKVKEGSFVQTTKDGIGYSQVTYLLKGPFKGDIYAMATDYAENHPTANDNSGIVLDEYKGFLSKDYEGYVAPYDSIIEDKNKHKTESHIEITPEKVATATQSYVYNGYKYSGVGEPDSELSVATGNTPLYNSSVEKIKFDLTVTDNYSGIKKIVWSVVGQDNQDSKNNQAGEVTVDNIGNISDDSWKLNATKDRNLITSLTKEITVNNNSNDIVIEVELTDRAGNVSYDYYILGNDTTAPSIDITVSGDISNGKYSSVSREVTIVVTERNFDPKDFDLILTKNENDISVNGKKLEWSNSDKATNATNSTTHTAKYTISAEGDYTLKAKMTDIAGNVAENVNYTGKAPTKFVIDKTSPTVSISMTGTSKNKKYYFNEDREVTVVVTDRNFNPNDVTLTVTKDGGAVNSYDANLKWTQDQSGASRTNATTNTAVFTISAEGDYTFDFTCNDLASKKSEETKYVTDDCKQFTIDKTAPQVVISEMVYQSANNGKNNSEKISIPLTVSVSDANIGNYYSNNTIDSNDVIENLQLSTVDKTYTYDGFALKNSSRTEVIYAVSNIETDGIYVLNLNIQDCAGNKITSVTYNSDKEHTTQQNVQNGSTDFFTFSVNRNGSTYGIDKNTRNLVETYYVQYVENNVVINEINVDELDGDNLISNIKITKNGETIDARRYVNVDHNKNSSAWNNYTYTINKDCFIEEATYTVSVESKDAASNNGFSELGMDVKLNFIVDRTVPVASVLGVTQDATYSKDSQPITVTVDDDVLLSGVIIKLNGEELVNVSGKDMEEYFVDGKFVYDYVINESKDAQYLSVMCVDAAQNKNYDESNTPNGLEITNFLVTTDKAAQIRFWIQNNVIWFVLICVGIVSAVAGLVVLIVYLKKRTKNSSDK